MSTTAQSDVAHSSRQRGSLACNPLFDVATKDLFRKNAFRITGIPIDASIREVDRHSGKLKMLAEFGHDPDTQGVAFAIKPPPTLDEIRDAIQKIKDPEKRLIDEFFWFWPAEFGNGQSDPAMQALAKGDVSNALEIWNAKESSTTGDVVACHNLALVHHISAMDGESHALKKEIEPERRQAINDNWNGAFKRWKLLTNDEKFWEKVTTRIRQLNEPNLPTGFARRMRATLPEALDKINAELAVAFAESGKIEIARLHIGYLRGPEQRQDKIEKIAELVLTPVNKRLKEQIKSARDRGENNPSEAANVALELLQQSRQTLTLFELFFGSDNELRNDLFDEVASACNRLQVVYHEATNDEKTCLSILNSVLSLATAIELRQQIEKNIGTLTGFIAAKDLEPVYTLLKSIQDSKDKPRSQLARFNAEVATILNTLTADLPRGSENRNQLFDSAAIVLRGISLEAWNKHHDKTTAVAANRLAMEFACDPPLKQKLREDQSTLTKFSNPFGDAGGEYTRMERGQYDSMIHVAIAFAGQVVVSGILALGFVTNILKIPCDDTASWIVGGFSGLGIALLVFWNRWKCIEAFSSQASCGIANISVFYVPIVALMYANWRGIKKICDRREWENTGSNKSCRLALAASAIVLILGAFGYGGNANGNGNNASQTLPVSAPATSPAAPSAPSPYAKPVYRVPSSANAEIERDSLTIDLEKNKAETLSKQLAEYKVSVESEKTKADDLASDLESLGNQIDRDRITLDRENQFEVDDFNRKVNRHNAMLRDVRAENDTLNQMIDNYNAMLEQVRTQNRMVNQMVDRYNSKLRQ